MWSMLFDLHFKENWTKHKRMKNNKIHCCKNPDCQTIKKKKKYIYIYIYIYIYTHFKIPVSFLCIHLNVERTTFAQGSTYYFNNTQLTNKMHTQFKELNFEILSLPFVSTTKSGLKHQFIKYMFISLFILTEGT